MIKKEMVAEIEKLKVSVSALEEKIGRMIAGEDAPVVGELYYDTELYPWHDMRLKKLKESEVQDRHKGEIKINGKWYGKDRYFLYETSETKYKKERERIRKATEGDK